MKISDFRIVFSIMDWNLTHFVVFFTKAFNPQGQFFQSQTQLLRPIQIPTGSSLGIHWCDMFFPQNSMNFLSTCFWAFYWYLVKQWINDYCSLFSCIALCRIVSYPFQYNWVVLLLLHIFCGCNHQKLDKAWFHWVMPVDWSYSTCFLCNNANKY